MRIKKHPSHKKLRKENIDFWSDRKEFQEPKSENVNTNPGFSASVIEYHKQLAQQLEAKRLEYIEKYKKEPELNDFEKSLIAKYC